MNSKLFREEDIPFTKPPQKKMKISEEDYRVKPSQNDSDEEPSEGNERIGGDEDDDEDGYSEGRMEEVLKAIQEVST
jgi:hypothetical protein